MARDKQNTPSTRHIIFAYLVVYIVWGSTFFFIETALRSFSPFVLGSIRFIIAGSLLMGYCFLKGYKLYARTAVKDALFVGFLLLFVDMAAIVWAEQYISSAIVTIIAAATAIWFVILDKPKWKDNFSSLTTILGLIFGFIGVFLLFAEQLFTATNASDDNEMRVVAMLVLLCGTIAWTSGSLLSKYKKEQRERQPTTNTDEDLPVMVKTAWQMVCAGVAFTFVACVNGEYARFQIRDVHLADWGGILYLATMGSVLAFGCYIWLLQHRPATEVSSHAYINPIVALLLAHYFTEHHVTALQITGLVIVLTSVLLMNWKLYHNNRTMQGYRRAKQIERSHELTPESSIPRIMSLSRFNQRHEKKKEQMKIKH